MDFHLEKGIRFNGETKHKSLYSWCLQETASDGAQLGRDLIPWAWNSWFTVSEFTLNRSLSIDRISPRNDNRDESEKEVGETDTIVATLHPGVCHDGKWLQDATTFSMFGTDRPISHFTLRIARATDETSEGCSLWGGVSYTTEIDFRDETSPDSIELILRLASDRYSKLAESIVSKSIDVATLRLGQVSGFYSDWSPSISTSSIKVLTAGDEHKIDFPPDCKINPPRLGDVGEFQITLVSRNRLDSKPNFTAIDFAKQFEEEVDVHEEFGDQKDESESESKLLLVQLMNNQAEIKKIQRPLWIAVVLLALILLS